MTDLEMIKRCFDSVGIEYAVVGERFEVTLGACECTDRELRMCHNLPNMLINGAFYRDEMVLF